MALGDRRLQLRVALEGLEATGHGAWKARRFIRIGANHQQPQPSAALLIRWHPVRALEHCLLDAAVGRDLDRVPDRQPVGRHRVMRLVDLSIDRQPERPGLGSGAQPRRLALHVHLEAQLKLEPMTGRKRVESALAMKVADRPPVAAWGHTYREEWAPEDLAAVTVERARRFGWDFVKFQVRASCFAEAFGSVYHPSGHRLRAPILIRPAVPDLDSWASVELMNRQALDDQVDSIRLVARELPSQAVSWSIHNQGNPSLAAGREIARRAVMGGLSQRSTLVYGPPAKIKSEADRAVKETGGRGLLLAPGCSVSPRVRETNLEAIASAMAA